MSHTTYNYTRDRLGFDPDREERRLAHYAGVNNGHNGAVVPSPKTNGGSNGHKNDYENDLIGGIYEENLSKFKGLFLIFSFFKIWHLT